jgi:SAM-dependent methyltransferase
VSAAADFTKYRDAGAYHWGKLAGRGVSSYHARLRARYGWFVERAVEASPSLVVDVGAGDAALTHLLWDATRCRVLGVEPEEPGVEQARGVLAEHGSGAEIVHGRGEALPVADGEASVVTLCEVVEHVPEPEALVAEAARALGPGGRLLVSTPQSQGGPLPPFHFHEFEPEELRALLARHFATVDVRVAEPPWLLAAYRRRGLRHAVNAAALAGANPFERVREPSGGTRRWRGLYAVAGAAASSRASP